MEFDLKGKMADVAGDTLKNVGDSNGKLSNENTESAQKLTNKTTRVALETGKAVGDKLVNKRQKAPETNKQAANRILLHEDTVTESAGATLHTSNGKSKLMTASRRRRVRDKQAVNDIKLRDNRKKLQKKLRQQYEIKATVKGGLKTDLQVEVGAESKMHESSKYAGISSAASFGKRTLHMADNMANDEKGLGIQNAWTDTASKTADAVSTVYTISKTAKYWRMQKNEKEIAKLLKQEDKIARNSIKMEYRTALGRAKESDLWKNSNLYDRHLQKKAVKRKYMKNAIKEYQNAKKAKSAAVTFTTGFNPMDKVKQGAGKLWEAVKALFSSPVGKIVIVFMLVLALMMSFLGVAAPMLLLSFGGDSDFSSPQVVGTGFPAEVESWRTWVTERCKANNDASSGIDLNDYVNAILATIQQESGGISSSSGGDLMQCKKQMIPTDDGIKLITILPDVVKSPQLTADWENELVKVARGETSADDFMCGITDMVSDLVSSYSSVTEENKGMFRKDQEEFGKCPKCGKSVVKGKFGPYCTGKCGMGFAKAFGVTLTDNQVKNLLEGKKILVKGITNKAGKVYDAYLTPNGTTSYSYTDAKGNTRSGFQYSFNMEFPKKK